MEVGPYPSEPELRRKSHAGVGLVATLMRHARAIPRPPSPARGMMLPAKLAKARLRSHQAALSESH